MTLRTLKKLFSMLWPFGKNLAKWSEKKLMVEYVRTAAAFDNIINSPCVVDYPEFDDAWRAWYGCEKEWALRGYAPIPLEALVQAHAARQSIYGHIRPLQLDADGGVVFFAPNYMDRYMDKKERASLPN